MNGSILSLLMMLIASSTLAIMPSIASDYALDIFGNANMDDTIDEDDIAYVEGIIDGTNEATELADANYDDRIDEEDITQIELIILGEEKELTLIDSEERFITVKKPVEHVVLLSNYPAEALRILKAQDKVVGVVSHITQDEVYFPEFSKLPDVGNADNYEAILSLHPDLVFVLTRATERAGYLPGVTVVLLPLWKPDDFIEELVKTGYIFGKKDEANYYIDEFHDKYIDLIKLRIEKISEDERPKVYVGGGGDRDLYGGFGAKSGAQQMIDLCGGRNVLADIDAGNVNIDPEEIMVKNPDIIIRYLGSSDAGYRYDDTSKIKALWEDTINRPELADVNAVKNNRVYIIDNGLNYGLDYPIAMIYWAKWFHPELFEDVDPKSIHQEYVTEFQGLDFDVSEHGIFVYHPDLYPDGR